MSQMPKITIRQSQLYPEMGAKLTIQILRQTPRLGQ